MEQHPVPQNVTNFQFKLIGDITLKQFGYLSLGLLIGYLCTKIPLVPEFVRWSLGGLFAILGFGLAFVPVEERPMDRWLIAFFKSIYAPTQFVWKKQNEPPEILIPLPQIQVVTPPLVVSVKPLPKPTLPPKPIPVPQPKPPPKILRPPTFAKTSSYAKATEDKSAGKPPQPPKSKVVMPPVATPPKPPTDRWTIGAPPVVKNNAAIAVKTFQTPVTGHKVVFRQPPTIQPILVNSSQQAQVIKSRYEQMTQKLSQQIALLQKEMFTGKLAKERFLELQQLLMQLSQEKERLDTEVVELRRKLAVKEEPRTETPNVYTSRPSTTMPTVKIIAPQAAVRSGIPTLTNQPNVITGIIKDSRGTLLANLIVTVKDREGMPVRALKTNKLGQFAASTPLANNMYHIEVEDPKKMYQFNQVEVNLSGRVLPPLEISAVSEKDIVRNKLSQELFGGNKI